MISWQRFFPLKFYYHKQYVFLDPISLAWVTLGYRSTVYANKTDWLPDRKNKHPSLFNIKCSKACRPSQFLPDSGSQIYFAITEVKVTKSPEVTEEPAWRNKHIPNTKAVQTGAQAAAGCTEKTKWYVCKTTMHTLTQRSNTPIRQIQTMFRRVNRRLISPSNNASWETLQE